MPEVVTDLPAGAKRLTPEGRRHGAPRSSTARSCCATTVNGQVLLRDNEPTGNLPGKLLRKRR